MGSKSVGKVPKRGKLKGTKAWGKTALMGRERRQDRNPWSAE
jgi:hypothetical protein